LVGSGWLLGAVIELVGVRRTLGVRMLDVGRLVVNQLRGLLGNLTWRLILSRVLGLIEGLMRGLGMDWVLLGRGRGRR
jgi:hypothetical protein